MEFGDVNEKPSLLVLQNWRWQGRGQRGSAVQSSLLRTKTSLLASPSRASPPRQISPFRAGISFLMWRGPPLPPLGLTTSSYITVSLSSHVPPPPRKARSYTSFRKADWERFTAESERRFVETPLPTSMEKKIFRRILSDTRRHHITCGHVRDYCGPLPYFARPLIPERDQRRIDDPLNLVIKLLYRDI